jgi:hypothetical protein
MGQTCKMKKKKNLGGLPQAIFGLIFPVEGVIVYGVPRRLQNSIYNAPYRKCFLSSRLFWPGCFQ